MLLFPADSSTIDDFTKVQGSRFPVPDAVGRVRDAMLFMPVRHMERAEEGLQDRREKRGLGVSYPEVASAARVSAWIWHGMLMV